MFLARYFRAVLRDQYPWAFGRTSRRAPTSGIWILFGSGYAGFGRIGWTL